MTNEKPNNNRDYKNLRIAAEIVGTAIAIGIAWATLKGDIRINTKDISYIKDYTTKTCNRLEDGIDRNRNQIIDIYKTLNKIDTSVQKIDTRQQVVVDDLKDIKDKLK